MSRESSYQRCAGPGGDASVRLAGEDTKDRMYEPKHHQKAVRVLTVVAYVFFVSLAAIMLSLYYMFLWNPTMPPNTKQPLGANSNISTTTECNQGQFHTVAQRSVETPRVLPIMAEEITTEQHVENTTATPNNLTIPEGRN